MYTTHSYYCSYVFNENKWFLELVKLYLWYSRKIIIMVCYSIMMILVIYLYSIILLIYFIYLKVLPNLKQYVLIILDSERREEMY